MRSGDPAPAPSSTDRIENNADPSAISMLVRSPAGLRRYSRSSPIAPPRTAASASRRNASKGGVGVMPLIYAANDSRAPASTTSARWSRSSPANNDTNADIASDERDAETRRHPAEGHADPIVDSRGEEEYEVPTRRRITPTSAQISTTQLKGEPA